MKIISRWTSEERGEQKKVLSRTHHVVLEISPGRRVYQVESFEDFTGEEEQGPKLFIESEKPVGLNFDGPQSTMNKGKFRDLIRWGITHDVENPSGGIDLDKLDLTILKTNRQSRKNFGGLVYTEETIKVALKIYKTL